MDQMGYLAGTLAGLMTQSEMVGCVAAMQIQPVELLAESYRNATQCANPNATAIVTYTGTFGDPQLGAQVAQQMIDRGADAIFGAGGPTGSGAIVAATQSGAWGIGVDTDNYISVFMNGSLPGSDRLLSSATKNLDNAVFDTIADFVSGNFTPGTTLYDVAVDGVGLAPFHETGSSVPSTVRGRLERIRQDMILGRIDLDGPCPDYMDSIQVVVTPTETVAFTGGGGLATVIFPPETFAETALVTYAPQVPTDPGDNLVGLGLFYQLEAVSWATGQPVLPQRTFTMTASYFDEEVQAAQVVNESGLAFYYWDDGQWARESTSAVDPSTNMVTATPSHLSLWTVMAERRTMFLPIVLQ
jgi:hypothetical protein